jgi:replication-associated recombination protein RarA
LKSNRNLGQRGQPAIYFLGIVIFASEDVGLADPEALPLAIATQQSVEFVRPPKLASRAR